MAYLAQQHFGRIDRIIQNKRRDKGASCEGLDGAIHGRGGLDKVGDKGIKESEFCLIFISICCPFHARLKKTTIIIFWPTLPLAIFPALAAESIPPEIFEEPGQTLAPPRSIPQSLDQ
jgi:hypothetical protein